jgi:tetratricopeptide (TPR) repeat protein
MIKKIAFNVAYFIGLSTFCSIVSVPFSSNVMAQEVVGAKVVKKSVKVPAMRNRVYAQLARAQKLADEGVKLEGFDVLDEVQERIDTLNSYERAMLWNFYGFMYYGNDDVDAAIDSFEKVIAEEAIPESLKLSTLYSLAQLTMQQQDYDKTLAFLATWKDSNTKPLTTTQLMLFAQVNYQHKQYQPSLEYIVQAFDITLKANQVPKENWLVLKRANHFELKQTHEVVKVIEDLVRYYDKPQYWLQLSGMYGEVGEEDKQLAVMESAWQAGYVTQSSDILTLVQLYRFKGVPYKAATLLASELERGRIIANEKTLSMLAQAYIAAKNDVKAIPVLQKAAEIADTGKFDAQLAQTYLNTEKWPLAIASANKALQRGGIERTGDMHLILGMSFFNLQKFDDSLIAFTQAQKESASAKTAKQWFHYVEREQGQQKRLAMLK